MKRIRRREFIKYCGGLIGLLLLGKYAKLASTVRGSESLRTEEANKGVTEEATERVADGLDTVADERNKFAMVIDVGACIGCRRCMWGCKEENNVPDTVSPPWIEVFELKSGVTLTGHPSLQDLKEGTTTSYTESPREGRWYLPVQCNHCDNPPCVKVCPTGATYKDIDGLVLMNYDKCIGCRLCVVACPYSARRFNWFTPEINQSEINLLVPIRPVGVVEKCTFCIHRVREGKLPRCVEVCPPRARHFGDLNDPESEVSKILKSNMSSQLLEEANTEPNIWYITRGKKWLES